MADGASNFSFPHLDNLIDMNFDDLSFNLWRDFEPNPSYPELEVDNRNSKLVQDVQIKFEHHTTVVNDFEQKSHDLHKSMISVVKRVKEYGADHNDIFNVVKDYISLSAQTKKSEMYLDKFQQLYYSNLSNSKKKSIRNNINAKTSAHKNVVSSQAFEQVVILLVEEVRAATAGHRNTDGGDDPNGGGGGGGDSGNGGGGDSGDGDAGNDGDDDAPFGGGRDDNAPTNDGGTGSGSAGDAYAPGSSGANALRGTSTTFQPKPSIAYLEALMNWRTESSTWVSDEEDSSSRTCSEVDVPTDTNSTETEPEAEIREYPLDDDTQMHSSPSPKREASIETYEPMDVVPISNDESNPHQEAANITETSSFSAVTAPSSSTNQGGGDQPLPTEEVTLCDVMDSAQQPSHKAVKVFKCPECGMLIWNKRSNLTRHIFLAHKKERKFECQVPGCGKRFQAKSNLRRHVALVHKHPNDSNSIPSSGILHNETSV